LEGAASGQKPKGNAIKERCVGRFLCLWGNLLAGWLLNSYGYILPLREAANFAFLFIPFDFTKQLNKKLVYLLFMNH
jgi:hypothetical protein